MVQHDLRGIWEYTIHAILAHRILLYVAVIVTLTLLAVVFDIRLLGDVIEPK